MTCDRCDRPPIAYLASCYHCGLSLCEACLELGVCDEDLDAHEDERTYWLRVEKEYLQELDSEDFDRDHEPDGEDAYREREEARAENAMHRGKWGSEP